MRKCKKKILILGGNGLLGSHCHSTFSKDYETLSTYNSIRIDRKDFIKFSFNSFNSNFSDILSEFKPDFIINTAGLVSVDGCERDELKAMQLNSFFFKKTNSRSEYFETKQNSFNSIVYSWSIWKFFNWSSLERN